MLVPWFLITSYAYYIEDDPIVSDDVYDEICMQLAHRWPRIRHRHKHLVERDALDAGSAYYLSEDDYPEMVKGSLQQLRTTGEEKWKPNISN